MNINERFEKELSQLKQSGNYRHLRTPVTDGRLITVDGEQYVNMSSNDYLGLSSDCRLQDSFLNELDAGHFLMSSSSSRLVTGNVPEFEQLERRLQEIYNGRECIVVGSGYLANSGILPSIAGPRDLIIADKLVHASIIDGMMLSKCEYRRFNHNDMDHLESILDNCCKDHDQVWVVTESVFSMDGDTAPLQEIVSLKQKYGFRIYLDEAHAFGVYGSQGAGLASKSGLDGQVDIIVGTFGKAIASYGAFAIMDPPLREYLINKSRPVIFSTALPPVNLLWTRFVLDNQEILDEKRLQLLSNIAILAPGKTDATHIIPLMVPGNREVLDKADKLRAAGFWVTPIRYPTVPRGKERIRVSLSSSLLPADLEKFRDLWKNIG